MLSVTNSGRAAATPSRPIAGVGVGAVAGNEVEKNVKKTSYYAITVKLDSGGTRTVSQSAKPGLREGDRVRIDSNNRLALLAN